MSRINNTHISLSYRYNRNKSALTIGVFKRIGFPKDIQPMALSYADLGERVVRQASQNISDKIDANLTEVLLTVGSNLKAEVDAFKNLATNAAGKDIDLTEASRLLMCKYLKEDTKDITALKPKQFETIIANFMKEHDALPSDADMQVKLKGAINQGYMTAIEHIEKAKENGWTHLDLACLNLKVLPSEIGDLTALTHFYVNHNQLIFLPPEFEKLNRLQLLNLSNNQFNDVPPVLKKLNNLTCLILWEGNSISNPNNYSFKFNNLDETQAFLKSYFE